MNPINTNDGLTEAFEGDSAPVAPLSLNITTSEVGYHRMTHT